MNVSVNICFCVISTLKLLTSKLSSRALKNYDDLKGICENSLEEVSSSMFSTVLISQSVKRKQLYEAVIADFIAGFGFMKTLPQVEEHCKKLFSVLHELGGPFLFAEHSLKLSVTQRINKQLKLSMNFD